MPEGGMRFTLRVRPLRRFLLDVALAFTGGWLLFGAGNPVFLRCMGAIYVFTSTIR